MLIYKYIYIYIYIYISTAYTLVGNEREIKEKRAVQKESQKPKAAPNLPKECKSILYMKFMKDNESII